VLRASLIRTARRLFAGSVFVPDSPVPDQGDS
jgi:2-methylaconitate cis-trans-isomerase PrpF